MWSFHFAFWISLLPCCILYSYLSTSFFLDGTFPCRLGLSGPALSQSPTYSCLNWLMKDSASVALDPTARSAIRNRCRTEISSCCASDVSEALLSSKESLLVNPRKFLRALVSASLSKLKTSLSVSAAGVWGGDLWVENWLRWLIASLVVGVWFGVGSREGIIFWWYWPIKVIVWLANENKRQIQRKKGYGKR